MTGLDPRSSIKHEARRIEEDAEHSAKGHFNAAAAWQAAHYWVGIPTVVFAALAGAKLLSADMPMLAASFAALASGLAAVLTFLNPNAKAESHRAAGRQFLTLRNETRTFREIDILALDDEAARSMLAALSKRRNDLNEISPDIPRRAYERARKDIDEGRSRYRVDAQKGN